MKALSVRQPAAWAIMQGIKLQEFRTWRPSLSRGERFAIHACATLWQEDVEFIESTYHIVTPDEFDVGAVIGSVIFDGVKQRLSDIAWNLIQPVNLGAPIDIRGRLGIWNLPNDIEQAIAASLQVK